MGLHRRELALSSVVRHIRGPAGVPGTAPASTTFSPLSLSPALWLKADAGTLQTVGGAAASADADPVGQWLDQSGNGNHVSQATASSRPALKLAIQNSLPIVRFDGVDDFLSAVATSSLNLGDVLTIFVAFKNSGGSATQALVDKGTTAYGFVLLGGNLLAAKANVANIVASTSPVGSTFHTAAWTKSGATNALYLDGTDVTGAVTNQTLADTASALTVGVEVATLFLNGDIGEVLVFPTALSAGNLASVQAYLKARWGTP